MISSDMASQSFKAFAAASTSILPVVSFFNIEIDGSIRPTRVSKNGQMNIVKGEHIVSGPLSKWDSSDILAY